MDSPQVWLVTGAASGFGRSVTELLLKSGNKVIATDLRPDGLQVLHDTHTSEQLIVLKMDVSNSEEIVAAFAAAKNSFGRLDVVFSNAGYSVAGEIESVPLDAARKLFDVNFWGSVQVALEAVKIFREVNRPIGGRLLITSSMAGLVYAPDFGYYVASKHALEGFTETLSNELDPAWNIKISVIEPGTFKTGIFDDTTTYPSPASYTNPNLGAPTMRSLVQSILKDSSQAGHPDKAAVQIVKLARLPEPPLRLPLGKGSIPMLKGYLAKLQAEVEPFESWSDDLTITQQ